MSLEKERYKYLAKLIKRGHYSDGKPFQFIDFFKYINHYEKERKFVDVISEQLSKYFETTDETYTIIVDFVKEHSILFPCSVTREELYDYEAYVYERQVTKEMIDAGLITWKQTDIQILTTYILIWLVNMQKGKLKK